MRPGGGPGHQAQSALVIIISKSGGARMMEAGFSLMQMAKTSAKLSLLARKKLPYISLLTDPHHRRCHGQLRHAGRHEHRRTPRALVVRWSPGGAETIGKDLPEGFQTSEFVLEHGFLDPKDVGVSN